MILGFITLLISLIISAVAGYFSIVGLAAIFAATYWPVVVMGSVLEIGKIVSVAWLHRYWKTAPKLLKGYLVSAVAVLMIITSMGIFGFLSKGHMEQGLPAQEIALKTERVTGQIDVLNQRLTDYQNQMKQLDDSIDIFLKNGKASQGLSARTKQTSERKAIQKQIDDTNKQIDALQAQRIDLKSQNVLVDAKLGPILYVAQLFGWKDYGTAVSIVIFMIMFAFDPVALCLLIASQYSFMENKKQKPHIVTPNIEEKKTTARKIEQSQPQETVKSNWKPFESFNGDNKPKPDKIELTPELEDELLAELEQNPVLAKEILEALEKDNPKN